MTPRNYTVVRDMDPELVDAEYTTTNSKEAESVWEILDDIVVLEYFKP